MSADSAWVIVITLALAFIGEFIWHQIALRVKDRSHMNELLDWIKRMYAMGYRDGLEASIPVLRLPEKDKVPEAFTKAMQ